MDAHLKLLAEVGLAVGEAEEALAEGAPHRARERLDAAHDGLAALRDRWPGMSGPERRLVGATAAPLRRRLDDAGARLPRRSGAGGVYGA